MCVEINLVVHTVHNTTISENVV